LTKFDPTRLEIEITESILVGAIDSARSVIENLQSRGISVALDDLGTGYSSLSYLNLFNVDRIKIDAEFVKGIGISENAKSMFSSIFELIRNRGFKITVEGVENIDQVVFLSEFENFWYQGYLFSKPLPYIDLIKSKFLQDKNDVPIFDHTPAITPSLQLIKSSA
jgi:EAL domain-containing protein (putative c-di-GMP-specific phosphodiesterase class I)